MDTTAITRLTGAWYEALGELDVTPARGARLHRGLSGHTLSGPVVTAEGEPAWLRVVTAPEPDFERWMSAWVLDDLIGDEIPHPRLLVDYTSVAGSPFHALLTERLGGRPVSSTRALERPVELGARWWRGLRGCLDRLSRVPSPSGHRSVTREEILAIPEVLPEARGVDLTAQVWESAHGGLHWANVTDPLGLVDWNDWGVAPRGLDAATLHVYALTQPRTAARVRTVFRDLLEGDQGRIAHLIACARVVRAERDDATHARLAPRARSLARSLL
ncbi:hypothetical protein [Nocardiopsis alba]|uniref:hypothetical protein n=1 Tax=Nocardiopsis alba TaxID=53437 RepID=UPI0036439A64